MDEHQTADADAVEETAEAEETSATEEESSSQDDQDYEAIAAEEAGRADPVRATIAFKERKAIREAAGDDGEEEEQDDEDRPLTRRELNDLLAQRDRQQNDTALTETARSLAESDAHAKAILATWKNRSFPVNLSLREQMEEAKAIVDRKRNVAKSSEVERAAKAKETVGAGTSSVHRDPPATPEPKMSAADRKGIKDAGYVWDPVKRVYAKKLGGGKTLYMRDLKSDTWIE